ncbi:MAG: FtsX-like permease family protein [Anaerolineae bacterium]|nr:FtsX-like permease family protein [Anaerolineae bacterium]
MLSPRWRKVVRDLWDNKSRTMLVVLSIAIGVFAFGSLFLARNVAATDLDRALVDTHIADITFGIAGFDDTLVRWAARQPGVTASEGTTTASAKLILPDGSTHSASLTAYADYDQIQIDRIMPQTGAWPLQANAVYLERSYAEKVDLQIGDPLTVELPDGRREGLVYGGSVHDFSIRPAGMQSTFASYVTPETLHRLGIPTLYNHLMITVDRSSATLTESANTLRDELVHQGVHVASVNINDEGHWAASIFDGLATVLVLVGLVSLILSAFLVVNTISGFMAQQKRSIGIMKIIGASRGQIIGVYMVMVACFGGLALVLALPTSLLFASRLVYFIAPHINLDITGFQVPFSILLMEIAVAFITPMVAALFPILSGTGIPPAQAVSDYVVQTSNNPLDVLLARLKGISRPALLSIRNTFRRKMRLLMTMITLTLAGAFFMSIVNVRNGLNTDIAILSRMADYDIFYALSSVYPKEAVERRVRDQPGVEGAEGWAAASVAQALPGDEQGSNFTLTGLPYDSALVDPLLVEGRWLDAPDYDNRYDIVISDDLQNDSGLKLGDTLTLKMSGEEHGWRIVGIIDGYGASAYTYYDTLARATGRPDLIDRVVIRAAGADSAYARQLELTLEQQGIDIAQTTLRADIIAGVTGGFNVIVIVLLAMAVLIAAVAGLGLTGTMSLNVLERTREIGVMRAVGAGTNTLRLMFVGEGMLIGLLTFVIALPLSFPTTRLFGAVLGNVIFDQPLAYAPAPEGPLIWLVLVMIVSAIASIAPAQRASEISIREALAYE